MNTHVASLPLQTKLFVGGRFQDAAAGATFKVYNPADGNVITEVAAGEASDIDKAVAAAHAQFESGEWSKLTGADRGRLLYRLADLIERDKEIIARMETIDNGKPLGMSLMADLPNLIDTFRYFAGWADKMEGRAIPVPPAFDHQILAYTIREPLGVIGAISAYNAPTMFIGWKAAPALAAGNTIVMKPPEEAPLTQLYVAKLFEEAGFPAGVYNVVSGLGPVAGMALVSHPLIAKVSYTGSGHVGRIIAKEAAAHLKPLTLELGGKAPQIVLKDADLAVTVPVLAMGLFANQGQICAAGTRVLVHRSRFDEVVDALAAAAKSQKLGDPLDFANTMGPLTTARSVDRVETYVRHGKDEGAKLVAGGGRGNGPGYFFEPTIFAGNNHMKIAQEEIFGPVGTVIPFDDNDEAIAIANHTQYGLNAGIFTTSLSDANLVARKIRTGAVWINGFGLIDPRLPWGGVKASGYGRENSINGLLDVTHEKVVTALL
jgi:betaine-aldehyde dehydrogenase